MIDAARNLVQSDLLAALPPEQWKRWQPDLEYADVPLADVLYEPGDTLTHVYFTTTSIVSLLYVMKNGEPAEIAVVGNDGVVGSRCSWVVGPPQAARWCKVPAAGNWKGKPPHGRFWLSSQFGKTRLPESYPDDFRAFLEPNHARLDTSRTIPRPRVGCHGRRPIAR